VDEEDTVRRKTVDAGVRRKIGFEIRITKTLIRRMA
jgi:hypothetical protein